MVDSKMLKIIYNVKTIITICLLCLCVTFADATTWVPVKKTDPFTGAEVTVHETVSFGNYIYRWPSKFDLIFWPWTDENWIWFCPKSGYASFAIDFDKLSDQEKEQLPRWLKTNYDPINQPKTHKEKLSWLEKVYTQRNVGEAFWLRFYRLMAFIYREDKQKSLEYVKKALPLLEKKLNNTIEGINRIEVLYLLGEYNRRIGQEEKALEYFSRVKGEKYKDKDGIEKTRHPYFLDLIKDRENLFLPQAKPPVMSPKPEPRMVFAKWPTVSLREGPGMNFKILVEIKKGTGVSVLEDKGQWLRVSLEDGREGWIGKATISETP